MLLIVLYCLTLTVLYVLMTGMDDYNSDSSLTAAVSRSLNLTQALGEKCLNLDISTASSDDEDTSRHSRVY